MAFNTDNDPALVAMVNLCADWVLAAKCRQRGRWITLMGNSGVGKTHCARRLWEFGMKRSNWDAFDFLPGAIYWPDFMSKLRSGGSYEKLREMATWPVLLLDDICAERDTTGFATEQLNMLLGQRENRWTIITTNLSLENLGQIDPRIADRIIREPNTFIQVNTKSYALK